MITTDTCVHGALLNDFQLARMDLAEARRRLVDHVSEAHRAAVVNAEAAVDAVLDMYLDAWTPAGTPTSARPPLEGRPH